MENFRNSENGKCIEMRNTILPSSQSLHKTPWQNLLYTLLCKLSLSIIVNKIKLLPIPWLSTFNFTCMHSTLHLNWHYGQIGLLDRQSVLKINRKICVLLLPTFLSINDNVVFFNQMHQWSTLIFNSYERSK